MHLEIGDNLTRLLATGSVTSLFSLFFRPCCPLSPVTRGHAGWAGLPGNTGCISFEFRLLSFFDRHILMRCWGSKVAQISPQPRGGVRLHVLSIICAYIIIHLSIYHLPIFLPSFLFSLPTLFPLSLVTEYLLRISSKLWGILYMKNTESFIYLGKHRRGHSKQRE